MVKAPWYMQPDKKPPDVRDAEEHAAIAAAFKDLPAAHHARRAYLEGADTIALTHLVGDQPGLAERLTEVYLAGWRRSLARWGPFRP